MIFLIKIKIKKNIIKMETNEESLLLKNCYQKDI